MDNRFQRSAEKFIMNLIGVDAAISREYFAEIERNQEFHNGIEENRSISGGRQRYHWYIGIGSSLGTVLYAICRSQKPDIVVETGVASGTSSSYILCAMEKNDNGQLYSIDQPWSKENRSGWMIPDYLRHRWHLIVGKSSEKLVPLLDEIGEINIFLHDSDHSYKNMSWEFQTAWKYLKVGGLLLAHNIDENDAFSDFCKNQGIEGYFLNDMGGIMKA